MRWRCRRPFLLRFSSCPQKAKIRKTISFLNLVLMIFKNTRDHEICHLNVKTAVFFPKMKHVHVGNQINVSAYLHLWQVLIKLWSKGYFQDIYFCQLFVRSGCIRFQSRYVGVESELRNEVAEMLKSDSAKIMADSACATGWCLTLIWYLFSS